MRSLSFSAGRPTIVSLLVIEDLEENEVDVPDVISKIWKSGRSNEGAQGWLCAIMSYQCEIDPFFSHFILVIIRECVRLCF
ncbi:hypothetical protein Y032_0174g436 [Ancylostoma ceylanicum]|uniref:Uncharacterized protein n=1 Tax=Ancylostoma ceylanicum TaxID=53326 RepID=A0A016STZ3_9BILA|nr:hypothetical protein Y032_0174g436 [Ancylostoma ceylanicum]